LVQIRQLPYESSSAGHSVPQTNLSQLQTFLWGTQPQAEGIGRGAATQGVRVQGMTKEEARRIFQKKISFSTLK